MPTLTFRALLYTVVQVGIAAVLPHVDDFVAGHSVAAYAELMEVLGSA